MSRVAIVIVSFNTRAALEACLTSLHDPAPVTDHDIVVVDNGSTDGSADAVRSGWPHAQVIAVDHNAGYACATNAGIRASSADLLLLLNSDTVVPAGSVDRLVAALEADGDGGHRRPAGPHPTGRARAVVWSHDVALERGTPEAAWSRAGGSPPGGRSLARSPRADGALPRLGQRRLPARAPRRSAEAVGLLDEQFFLYTEDIDFCAAMRRRGRRILFTPRAEIIHARGEAGATAPAATHRAYRRSHLAFYAKHHPRWVPFLRVYLRLRGELP